MIWSCWHRRLIVCGEAAFPCRGRLRFLLSLMDFETTRWLFRIVNRWCCCCCCHGGKDGEVVAAFVYRSVCCVCRIVRKQSALLFSFVSRPRFVASCSGCADSCFVNIVVCRIFFYLYLCFFFFLWKCCRCRDTVWSAFFLFFFFNDTTEWGKKSEQGV